MLSEYPKISIVMPSLNQGKYIELAIQSVLSQGYPNLELLVFDACSKDETISILKKFDHQISWVSQKDRGQTDAINKGLRSASGEVITYLNVDDLLLPGSLERVAKEFIAHPDILWLTGRCRIVNDQGNEIRKLVTLYKNLLLLSKSRHMLLVTNYISQPATFWRRSIMEKAGWFDEKLNFVMDYDYWLRLWNLAPPRIIQHELAAFRIHQQSKTTSAGHLNRYIDEESQVIARSTGSSFWRGLHALHRQVMTLLYAKMNG